MSERILMVIMAVLAVCTIGLQGAQAAIAKAELHSAEGERVGIASLSEDDQGAVQVVVHVQGLPPGVHALHIHETGTCTPPDFKSAGGHFNPFDREHGLKDPKGPHAGDLPNLVVAANGIGEGSFLAPMVTLNSGDNSLFKDGGTALVIHAGADDYHSEPSGDAGSRIACGVIEK